MIYLKNRSMFNIYRSRNIINLYNILQRFSEAVAGYDAVAIGTTRSAIHLHQPKANGRDVDRDVSCGHANTHHPLARLP